MHKATAILALTLLTASTLLFLPAQAQTASTWATESIPTSGYTATNLVPAQGGTTGEKVGVLFNANSAKTFFALRDTTWALKATDATSAFPTHSHNGLVWLGGTTWGMTTNSGSSGTAKFWRSTDDGATWSVVASGQDWLSSVKLVYQGGSKVAIAFLGFGSYIGFQTSTDLGSTWSTVQTLNDNQGGNSAPTQSQTMSAVGLQYSGTTYTAYMTQSGTSSNVYQITSSDGAFWTTPYTVNGGSVLNPFYSLCNAVANTATTNDNLAINPAYGFPGHVWHSGGKTYWCSYTGTGTTAQAVPSNTPTNSLLIADHAYDSNSGGQYLVALSDTVAGNIATYYKSTPTGSWASVDTITTTTGTYALQMTPTAGYVIYIDSASGQLKDRYASIFIAPSLTPIATTPVTNLKGFDVDPFNQVVVARTDLASGSSKIRTFDASSPTLAQRGASPLSSACNRVDGVLAYSVSATGKEYAGYVDCDGSNIINDFSIRGGDLNSPDQSGTQCENLSSGCDVDLSGHNDFFTCDGYQLPDGPVDMGSIAAIPISWEDGGGGLTPHAQIGFAYSNTANGNIGTWSIRQEETGGSKVLHSCRQEVVFSSPGNTYQICSWRNTVDNNDYIAAVGPSNPTKAWQFTIDSYSISNNLKTHLTPVAAGLSAPYDHLRAIACVDNDAIVMQASTGQVSRIHLVGGGIGGIVWGPIAAPTGILGSRGVAISRDGKWAAMASDATIQILNATSGAVLGSTPNLSGSAFRELRISSSGQIMWVAGQSRIDEYDIHGLTTVIPVAEGASSTGPNQVCRNGQNVIIPCVGTTTTSTAAPAGSFFGVDPARLDPSGSGDAVKGGFFLSLMIILGFASVGAAIIPSNSVSGLVWGAGLGALLGFGWTVFLGTMPAVITFILVVVGFAIIGFKIKAESGADA